MEDNRNYLNEFSLAFIEELQQGCSAFKFAVDDKFIENEFPHYAKDFENSLKYAYKLWKTDSDGLFKFKERLIKIVGQALSDKIKNDEFLRFSILKTFHDSQITEVLYDKEQNVLKLKIDYDDAFCKIPYGNDLTLIFYGVTNYDAEITNDDDCCLVISDYWYEIENEKVKLYFDSMDTYREWQDCTICFLYESAEIK